MRRHDLIPALCIGLVVVFGCSDPQERSPGDSDGGLEVGADAEREGDVDSGDDGLEDAGGELVFPDPPTELSFIDDVLPVLLDNECLRCHGGDGGYTCNNRYDAVLSGDNGPAIVPCEPDASPLIEKLLPAPSFGEQMPINGYPAVSLAEVSLLRQWIKEGAGDSYDPSACQ